MNEGKKNKSRDGRYKYRIVYEKIKSTNGKIEEYVGKYKTWHEGYLFLKWERDFEVDTS